MKQLLDLVFVMSVIIKVKVSVQLSRSLRLRTLGLTLIIPDITKASSNNSFNIFQKRSINQSTQYTGTARQFNLTIYFNQFSQLIKALTIFLHYRKLK